MPLSIITVCQPLHRWRSGGASVFIAKTANRQGQALVIAACVVLSGVMATPGLRYIAHLTSHRILAWHCLARFSCLDD
jgi:hypothetical protein